MHYQDKISLKVFFAYSPGRFIALSSPEKLASFSLLKEVN